MNNPLNNFIRIFLFKRKSLLIFITLILSITCSHANAERITLSGDLKEIIWDICEIRSETRSPYCSVINWFSEKPLWNTQQPYTMLPPYFTNLCNKGDIKACAVLGIIYENAIGIKGDYKKAGFYYKKTCDEGLGDGCLFYYSMMDKRSHDYDYKKIISYSEKSCELGMAETCLLLNTYSDYSPVLKNDQALNILKKQCNDGSFSHCIAFEFYNNGRNKLPSKKILFGKAAKILWDKCNKGNHFACNKLISERLNKVLHNVSIEDIKKRSKEIYIEECNKGNGRSCSDMAFFYLYGKGAFEKDSSKGAEYAKKGCDYGFAKACADFGLITGKGIANIKKDLHKAGEYMLASCEGGYALGCVYYGGALMLQSGTTIEESKDKKLLAEILKYMQKACSGMSPEGCFGLGREYELGILNNKDKIKAEKYYRMACEMRYRNGCEYLDKLINQEGGK